MTCLSQVSNRRRLVDFVVVAAVVVVVVVVAIGDAGDVARAEWLHSQR